MAVMVTRQRYYYQGGARVVEVTTGGPDNTGADALVEAYPHLGEGHEYDSAAEAVEAAIKIAQAWQADCHHRVQVATGSTGGMGMELEPDTYAAARAWAKEYDASRPKCDHCGELLGSGRRDVYVSFLPGADPDARYCSEYCADMDNRQPEDDEELDEPGWEWCAWCYTTFPARADGRPFCSDFCQSQYQAER